MALFLLLALFFLLSCTNNAEAQQDKLIIINKKINQLGFYQNGLLTNVFPVATGQRRSYTPEGKFKVINKIVNPPYYKKNIPGGSPNNPLGPRWLGLSAPGGPYGIHGNSNPNSIGTYASLGCIRLRNDDIKWLYEQVPIGTPVIIVWSDTKFTGDLVDNNPIKIYLNNELVNLANEKRAFIKQGKPYIPVKLISSLLGYNLTWQGETSSIQLDRPGTNIKTSANSTTAWLNGLELYLSEPPIIINGTTYINKETMELLLSVNVSWDEHLRTLKITNPQPVNIVSSELQSVP